MTAGIRVFLTSTWRDLQAERQAVEKVLHRMRDFEYSGMEYFGSRDESARDASLAEVAKSDLYIGILAGRFGSGITEAEYRAARAANLPCFFYVKRESRIAEDQREKSAEGLERLKAFRHEVTDPEAGHLSQEFSAPDDLASQVAADLHNWVFDKILIERVQGAAQAGEFGVVRQIAQSTKDEAPLRAALHLKGVTPESSLLDGLLILAGLPVVKQLVQGLEKLGTDYGVRIQNFLNSYLGTIDHPVAFGGRETELGRIDEWLDTPAAQPYLLISGGAGSGKSALLVHWSRRLVAREDLTLVFAPVSIRFRTSLAAVFFPILAARLAEFHGESISPRSDLSAEAWRGIVSTYLARELPEGRRLVLILDGLDEATDWMPGPDLLPLTPPNGLRIVASARYTAAVPDGAAWLRRLGLDAPGRGAAMQLGALKPAGVADVLKRAVASEDLKGTLPEAAREIFRLTDGDPLLVHLYVSDLQKGTTVRELTGMARGLEGYFAKWWEDQRTAWGESTPLRQKDVQAILSILSTALGPLTRDDILALAPGSADLSSWTLDDALRPIERFVTRTEGNGGYVFSHPRFASFLCDRMGTAEQRYWENRHLEWGGAEVNRLLKQELPPDKVSAYLVHYFGVLLEQGNSGPESLLRLANAAWRRAWEEYDEGASGFINDLNRIWKVIDRQNLADLKAGHESEWLPAAVYLAMVRAELRSSTPGLTPALRERFVETDVWKLSRAIASARLLPDESERAETLARLARFADDTQRTSLEQEALAAALDERDPAKQGSVLGRMVATFNDPPLKEFVSALNRLLWERRSVLRGATKFLIEKGDASTIIHAARDSHESLANALDPDALFAAVRQNREDVVTALLRAASSHSVEIVTGICVHCAAQKSPIPEWLFEFAESGGMQHGAVIQMARLARGEAVDLWIDDAEWILPILSGKALTTKEDVATLVLSIRERVTSSFEDGIRRLLPSAFNANRALVNLLMSREPAFDATLHYMQSVNDRDERKNAMISIAPLLPGCTEEQLEALLGEFAGESERNMALFGVALQLARMGKDSEAVEMVNRVSYTQIINPALGVLFRDLSSDCRKRTGLPLLRSLDPNSEARREAVAYLMDMLSAEVEESDLKRFADSLGRPGSVPQRRLVMAALGAGKDSKDFERLLAPYVNDTNVSSTLVRAGTVGSISLRRGIAAMILARPSFVIADVRHIGIIARRLPEPERGELFASLRELAERVTPPEVKLVMEARLENLDERCRFPIPSTEEALSLLARLEDMDQRRDVLSWLHRRVPSSDRQRVTDLIIEELRERYGSWSRLDELLVEALPEKTFREYEADLSQVAAPQAWPAIASRLDPSSLERLLRWANLVTTMDEDLVSVFLAFVPFLEGASREETVERLIGSDMIRHLGDGLAREYLFQESNGLDFWKRFGWLIERLQPEQWDAMVAEPDSAMRDLTLSLLCVPIKGADRGPQYRLLESLLAPRTEMPAAELLGCLIALTPLIEIVGGQGALENCRIAVEKAPPQLASLAWGW